MKTLLISLVFACLLVGCKSNKAPADAAAPVAADAAVPAKVDSPPAADAGVPGPVKADVKPAAAAPAADASVAK